MHVLGLLAISCGWLKGGHPERFSALVLLLDYLASRISDDLDLREIAPLAIAQDFVVLLAFAWLALRTDRWWPIAATASLTLCVLVRVLGMANPELSRFAMLSAILGFWILLYTVVLGGVAERWLAGEQAASGGRQWRRRSAPGQAERAAPSRST